jgi:hypothetical protein
MDHQRAQDPARDGSPSPRPRQRDRRERDPGRRLAPSAGVEANNSAYELLDRERTPEEDEELLRRAYAAGYHWQRASGAKPENEARASYVIARALIATGQPIRGPVNANQILTICAEHGIADFDLAYAHEAPSRALSALGLTVETAAEAALARSVPVADSEDRVLVERDLADLL